MSSLFIVDNGDKNWKARNYLHEMDKIMVKTYEVIGAPGGWPLAGSVKEE